MRLRLILLAALLPAHLATAAPPRASDKPALIGARSPEWPWRQILASPRIGGRLTAITVDTKNPQRIFVGTEEGTLIRSLDGGVTWDEHNITAFVIAGRSIGSRAVAAPDPEEAESTAFSLSSDPPNRFYADELSLPFVTELMAGDGILPSTGFPPSAEAAGLSLSLLGDSVASRREETVPVKRIVLCPGGRFAMLIATSRAVYGSNDGGTTVLRIFDPPNDKPIETVACSPWRPDEILIASEKGLHRSTNGGLSFNTVLTAIPNQPSTAVAFAREPSHNVPIVYDGAAGSIYGGDPDSQFGLEYLYPAYDDSETAPWEEIRWIEIAPAGEIWLATDDGVRVSRDHGTVFLNVEPRLFGGRKIKQVRVDAAERIAVMTETEVYTSDDEGATWHPFFHGITRRTLRQLEVARDASGEIHWWIVSSGEVWTTSERPAREGGVDRAAQAWARVRLESTPPLSIALERVLDHTELSPDRIEALADRARRSQWIPLIDVRVAVIDDAFTRAQSEAPVPREIDMNTDRREIEVLVLATWPLYEGRVLPVESGPVRESLYELRRQIAFAVEDAWHERWMTLDRIARGASEPDQIEILKTRVEALEAALDVWGWRTR